MSLCLITHTDCLLHSQGAEHPESPERLNAILQKLSEADFNEQVTRLTARPIERELLLLAHTPEYIEHLFASSPSAGAFRLDPDTQMNPHSLNAALLGAGAGVMAVEQVITGNFKSAFCAVRPPGHHAERDKAMGFCLISNIALAANYALKHFQLDRVAIVDFDVHHGNGTQDVVAGNEHILFCSTFQHPYYPFSGTEAAPNNIIDTPLPAGTSSEKFRMAISDNWLPALENFKPQLIFISAGFDAHKDDPLAQFNLDDEDYFWITQKIKQVADEHCSGKIVSMLEGGYSLDALGRSVVEHLRAMV